MCVCVYTYIGNEDDELEMHSAYRPSWLFSDSTGCDILLFKGKINGIHARASTVIPLSLARWYMALSLDEHNGCAGEVDPIVRLVANMHHKLGNGASDVNCKLKILIIYNL